MRSWVRLLMLVLLTLAGPAWAQQWTSAPAPVEGTELPAVPDGWTTVPGTYLRVHGPEELTGVLLRVARHGSTALPHLADELDVPIGETIHVYVAPDDATFRAIQPGLPPTWADATTWPKLGAVFLRAPAARPGDDEPLEQVFDHELVHVLLGRAFAPKAPPTWLQEGVAQVLAHELGPEEAATLQQASLVGALAGVQALELGFPADAHRAKIAYAESADFVAYLGERYGRDIVPKLVRESRGGATLRQTVYASTGGHYLEDVEKDWLARYDTAPVKFAALANGEWVWWIGAVVLAVAWVRRRREFKRRLAEMEAEEALVDQLLAARAESVAARWH